MLRPVLGIARGTLLAFAVTLVPVSAVALSLTGQPAVKRAPGSLASGVFVRESPTSRVLRGDWEAADLTVVVFSLDWPEALEATVREAARVGPVAVIVSPPRTRAEAEAWFASRALLGRALSFVDAPTDTPWIRDFGPLEVREADGTVRWLDAAYETRPLDDLIPRRLAERFGVSGEELPVSLDGGGVVSNGRGLCVSAVEIFARYDVRIEDLQVRDDLQARLGCHVWVLVPGLLDDPTRHADMFVQFVSAARVLLAESDDAHDGPRLQQSLRLLQEGAAHLGIDLEVVRVPLPKTRGGAYLSFVNGLQTASAYLVPRYASVASDVEQRAWAALQRAMPERRLLPVPSDAILARGGVVHCITLGLSLPTVDLSAGQEAKRRALGRWGGR